MQKIVTKFSQIIITAVLTLMLLRATPSNSQPLSATASPDSVQLSVVEADSLLLALDTYETELRLSRLSLARCQEFAELDSLVFEQYRAETRRTWLDKILHEPIIWFALGVYAGSQVGRMTN